MIKKIIKYFSAYELKDYQEKKIYKYCEIKNNLGKETSIREIMEVLDIDKKEFIRFKKALNKLEFLEVDDCGCFDPVVEFINLKEIYGKKRR